MHNHFFKICDSKSFEDLLSRSNKQPVVVFKHSTTCPISVAAYQEMASCIGEVAVVEVQTARDLSNEIEPRTGVSGESPQVLVLRNGRVVWQASHWQVTSDSVASAVRANM